MERIVKLLPIEEEIEVSAKVSVEKEEIVERDHVSAPKAIHIPRTQLRIGNLVITAKEWDADDNVVEWGTHMDVIDEILYNKIETHEWGNKDNESRLNLYEFKGVPLTDDLILIMFNFRNPEEIPEGREHFFLDKRKIFHYGLWRNEDTKKYMLTDKRGALLTPLRELKYVHELQNLYFASTDVEAFKTLPEHE